MLGSALLDEIEQRFSHRSGVRNLTDIALAEELGVTPQTLINYRQGAVTARQIVNLMEAAAEAAKSRLIEGSLVPLVEFFPISATPTDRGRYCLFLGKDVNGDAHPYQTGLRERLSNAHGIYVFHDSRGQAIYVGKAHRLTLWAEMNNAFNRNRGDVQNIKRVTHPTSKVQYKGPEEKSRQIRKIPVALHDIAKYISAYEVPPGLIGKFEVLIVRRSQTTCSTSEWRIFRKTGLYRSLTRNLNL